MKISKCVNCYNELTIQDGDCFCGNDKCFRYGLCTRRTLQSSDDLSIYLPKMEIEFMRFTRKENARQTS